VRSHLHDHRVALLRKDLVQNLLQTHGIGSRRGSHAVHLELSAHHAIAQRADNATAIAELRERLRRKLRAGGFTVRTGDADHAHVARRFTIEARGDMAGFLLKVTHRNQRHGAFGTRGVPLRIGVDEHRGSTAGDRGRNEIAAVGQGAFVGEEQIARLHAARIELHAAQHAVEIGRHEAVALHAL
jgi:hypothetical protein